ncbi:MAG: SDR family oxidoreductase [Terracidiphilus sp.]
MNSWTESDIPSQAGKLAVVTGATSGIGFETALALARAGADVIVAGCDETNGLEALGQIRPLAPGSLVRFEKLNLASLASVADFARRVARTERPLDLLVNNAGVMALPQRQVTVDGFEMQLGTNYLGHFALTGLLLPLLRRGMDPRVVQVSGLTHRVGRIHLDDLHLERGYAPVKAYSQSKLAMLMFALELQRRSDSGAWGLLSLAAHPGYARTGFFQNGPGTKSAVSRLHRVFGGLLGHSAAEGALSTLYAATSLKARSGEYYGPKGALGLAGPLGLAGIGKNANDLNLARKLWEASERLTRVEWPIPYAPPSQYPWPMTRI